MEVDDGNAKVLRVEMKEKKGNYEGVMEDKVMEVIVFLLPIIDDEIRWIL